MGPQTRDHNSVKSEPIADSEWKKINSVNHGRPHIGANGVNWPPPMEKSMKNLKKREHAKKSSFVNILRVIRACSCRQRRYADHIIFIQIYFRTHHFVVTFSKFSSSQATREHWPPKQNPADFPAVNIWQSYKQEHGCLMHFACLANTLLKDEESARDNHVLACNFAKYVPIKKFHRHTEHARKA